MPESVDQLAKIRSFFKLLSDHRYLIVKEKQGLKTNIYYDLGLCAIEAALLVLGWLFFRGHHDQQLFNLFVISLIVDMAFLIICFIFFVGLYYWVDRPNNS